MRLTSVPRWYNRRCRTRRSSRSRNSIYLCHCVMLRVIWRTTRSCDGLCLEVDVGFGLVSRGFCCYSARAQYNHDLDRVGNMQYQLCSKLLCNQSTAHEGECVRDMVSSSQISLSSVTTDCWALLSSVFYLLLPPTMTQSLFPFLSWHITSTQSSLLSRTT